MTINYKGDYYFSIKSGNNRYLNLRTTDIRFTKEDDDILDINLTKLSAAAILTPLFSYVNLCFFIIIKYDYYKQI